MPGHPPIVIEKDFADGVYRFRLGALHASELQKRRAFKRLEPNGATVMMPKPIGLIYRQMALGEIEEDDCRETIVQAAIGGSGGVVQGVDVRLDRTSARRLVEEECEHWSGFELWELAHDILTTHLKGLDKPGEPPGEGMAASGSTSPSTSPPLSET